MTRPGVRPVAALVIAVMIALLAAALLFAAAFGAVQLRPDDLLRMTLNHVLGAHFEATWRPQDEAIFFAIRLPRVAGAAIVGAALASAGVLFRPRLAANGLVVSAVWQRYTGSAWVATRVLAPGRNSMRMGWPVRSLNFSNIGRSLASPGPAASP